MPDWLGITSSGLCLIHCLVLPVVFFLPVGFALPGLAYWHNLDYAFLIISFLTCYFTSRRCTTRYIVALLWFFFCLLALSILLHEFSEAFEYTTYFASAGLISSHFLNIRYCKRIYGSSVTT